MGTNNGNFYALNTADGSVKWTYNLNDTVKSSAVLDPNDNTLFVGSDNGNFTALDMRDGTLKWSVNTGNVESTAALMGDNVVVTSTSGTVYVLNKFSGKEEWSYMPGYYIFNSPLSSPIVYGDDILAGDNNGNMYSLDFSRKTGPVSNYLYYVAAIVIVIIGGLIGVRALRNRRKKKGN
jgi:outer membrane protein assembly factor BamB